MKGESRLREEDARVRGAKSVAACLSATLLLTPTLPKLLFTLLILLRYHDIARLPIVEDHSVAEGGRLAQQVAANATCRVPASSLLPTRTFHDSSARLRSHDCPVREDSKLSMLQMMHWTVIQTVATHAALEPSCLQLCRSAGSAQLRLSVLFLVSSIHHVRHSSASRTHELFRLRIRKPC